MRHELVRLLVDAVCVDQQFADVLMKVVADRANHQARVLVDEESAGLLGRGVINRAPQLKQITEIPLELFYGPADSGRTRYRAHPLRYVQLRDGVTYFVALFALYTPRNASAAGIVGHEYEVAPGKADERRQRSAFCAALVLVNLNDELLAFLERILNSYARWIRLGIIEVGPADFLERKKTMTVRPIIYEGGFEAWFDAGDNTLVNITFALFSTSCFDIEVEEFLSIDDCNAQFFCLRCVKQHALHFLFSRAHSAREDKPGACP